MKERSASENSLRNVRFIRWTVSYGAILCIIGFGTYGAGDKVIRSVSK